MTFAHLKTKSSYEIINVLKSGERMSADDIASKVKYKRSAVVQALRLLHESKQIHISGWKRRDSTGIQMKLYTWGKGKDLPMVMASQKKREPRPKWAQCDVAASWMFNPC
jgi:transcription initiation factor IIE alpha subunit